MDIQAALRDGYSKQEIMAELGKRTGMKYESAIADGYSEDEVLAELNNRDTKTQPATEPKQEKSVGGFVDNVAKDIYGMGKGLVQLAGTSPLEVASGLGKLAVGGSAALQKKMGIIPESTKVEGEEAARQIAAPFVKAAREPLGIPGQIVDYAYEKPVSTALTASGGLFGAGKIAEGAGAVKTANALIKASEITNPLVAGSKAISPVVQYAVKKLPERLYGSAIKLPTSGKWTKTLSPEELSKRDKAIQAGLENKIYPTEYGRSKIAQLEEQARGSVDEIVSAGGISGETVNTEELIQKGLAKAYERATKSSDPIGAKQIVDDIAENFRAHGETIRVDKLNDIKRQLYDEVKWGGSEQTALLGQLKTMGKKGLAYEAKTALEDFHPELKLLNQKDAAYISLKEGIERATAKNQASDLVGLGAKVLATRSLPMAMFEWTIGHPNVKSALAFSLRKAGKSVETLSRANNALYAKATGSVNYKLNEALDMRPLWEIKGEKELTAMEQNIEATLAKQAVMQKLADTGNEIAKEYVKKNEPIFNIANNRKELLNQIKVELGFESKDIVPNKEVPLRPDQKAVFEKRILPKNNIGSPLITPRQEFSKSGMGMSLPRVESPDAVVSPIIKRPQRYGRETKRDASGGILTKLRE